MTADPRVDVYIAKQADFARPILTHLRETLHAAGLDLAETIKWGKPFFLLDERPFAIMAAFKAHASFGFWKRQGGETGREDEAMGQFGRITTLADLPDPAALRAMIHAAAAEVATAPAPRPAKAARPEAEIPADLAEALADDAAASATFVAFPPSCRREYCEWVGEAKRAETRAKRIAQTLEWLRAGKRRNWKYEDC